MVRVTGHDRVRRSRLAQRPSQRHLFGVGEVLPARHQQAVLLQEGEQDAAVEVSGKAGPRELRAERAGDGLDVDLLHGRDDAIGTLPNVNAPGRQMWDDRYGGGEYFYGTEPNGFLHAHTAAIPAGGRVLCIAEGEGRNAVHLARRGFTVSSFDLSAAGVRKTLRLAEEAAVTVDAVVADAAEFDVGEGVWDGIVSIFAHMPPTLRADLHRRVATGLKPGGVFLLEAYTPDQIGRGTGGPNVPEMMPTLEVLRHELAGLEEVHGEELVRTVIEGSGHTGEAAVVQFIARSAGSSR